MRYLLEMASDPMKFHTNDSRRRWPRASCQIEKATALIHSAIIDGGSGFQPRFTRSDKHFLMKFHMSAAAGQKNGQLK